MRHFRSSNDSGINLPPKHLKSVILYIDARKQVRERSWREFMRRRVARSSKLQGARGDLGK